MATDVRTPMLRGPPSAFFRDFRFINPTMEDSPFSVTIIDLPDHRMPRSSSKIVGRPKSAISLSVDVTANTSYLSNSMDLNLSPIQLALTTTGATQSQCSVDLSASKLDSTNCEMPARTVHRQVIGGACQRRLLTTASPPVDVCQDLKTAASIIAMDNKGITFKTPLPITTSSQIGIGSTANQLRGSIPFQFKAKTLDSHKAKNSPRFGRNSCRRLTRQRARLNSIRKCNKENAKAASINTAINVDNIVHTTNNNIDNIVRTTNSNSARLGQQRQLQLEDFPVSNWPQVLDSSLDLTMKDSPVRKRSRVLDSALDLTALNSAAWSATRRRISLDANGKSISQDPFVFSLYMVKCFDWKLTFLAENIWVLCRLAITALSCNQATTTTTTTHGH